MNKDNGKGAGPDLKTVDIHIDKENKKSPNPTTGQALYILGHVDTAKYDLWQEAKGKGDDVVIPNTTAKLELNNGDKFYTAQKNLNPGT